MRMLTILTAFCLLLGMAASASATPTPGVYVNGQLALALSPNFEGTQSFSSGGVSGTVTFDLDPGIIWSINATNTTNAAIPINAVFGPLATPGYPGAITVFSSITGGITDATGPFDPNADGSVSITPTNGTFISNNFTLDAQGNLVNTWGVGTALTESVTKGSSNPYPTQSLGPIGEPLGPNDFFGEAVQFNLSAFDSVGLSGNCSFVPLPPSALLFGSGLLALAFLRGRRKRQG